MFCHIILLIILSINLSLQVSLQTPRLTVSPRFPQQTDYKVHSSRRSRSRDPASCIRTRAPLARLQLKRITRGSQQPRAWIDESEDVTEGEVAVHDSCLQVFD